MMDLSKENKFMDLDTTYEALKQEESMDPDTTHEALKQEENINPNPSRQPLQQEENLNPNISRQPLKQEENLNPNISRQPSKKEENISPNLSSYPFNQKENTTPIPSHQNVNQSEHHKAAAPPPPQQQQQQEKKEPEPQGIFVYGTLMAEEFLSWVLTGSAENHKTISSLRQPATLRSYRRVAVVHADYPALIFTGSESDQVEGFLVMPSTRSQWKKLDDFEGESYRRQCVQVELSHSSSSKRTTTSTTTTTTTTTPVGVQVQVQVQVQVPAFVYVWQDPIMEKLLPYQDWSYDYFREHRLEDWLDLFEGMEMVGEEQNDDWVWGKLDTEGCFFALILRINT